MNLTANDKTVMIKYCILLIALWLSLGTQSSYAQTPEATPAPQVTSTPSNEDGTELIEETQAPSGTPTLQAVPSQISQTLSGITEVTFAQLNQPTFELRSPIQQETFSFDVPIRWNIVEETSYIEIHYDMSFEGVNNGTQEADSSVVNVYYNNILVDSFSPTEGSNQIARIPIPEEALTDVNENRNTVSIVYFSGNCEDGQHQSLLVVHDNSSIHFSYELVPVEINLANFPYPVAQNVFEPDHILIVIPDNYSDADLSAAASVAATMGLRTFGNATFDILTAEEATPERLGNNSAIIIGKPQDNALILDLYQRNRLPTTLTDGGVITGPANQPITPDDGVIQEIFSDYSDDHVYLTVTGTSDLAVDRAARALSVLAPRYGFDGNLVVIADFQEIVSQLDQSNTFSLADLGFDDTVFSGIGTHNASLNFFVPPNWRITKNPTFTLSYFHSDALKSASSGLTVSLNDQPVGSAPIGDGNFGERQVTIELPSSEIKSGARNKLSFEVITNLELPECVLPELDLIWFRINDSSQLQLPYEDVELNVEPSLQDPLQHFISRQDLSDVRFSLPANPTREELLGMINTAARLGYLTSGPGFAPQVSRGAIGDLSELDGYHLITFGLPTTNPTITQINDALPQPFVPGEDNLRQQVGNVVYRLPDNYNLGLVQILPAPWDPQKKAVLLGTGTSPQGEQWAINTLTDEDDYYNLEGNVAFITVDGLETFDTTDLVEPPLAAGADGIGVVPEEVDEAEIMGVQEEEAPAEPTAVPESVPDPEESLLASQKYQPPDTSPPILVTQLTFILIGAGLAIAAMGGIMAWRKAK